LLLSGFDSLESDLEFGPLELLPGFILLLDVLSLLYLTGALLRLLLGLDLIQLYSALDISLLLLDGRLMLSSLF
jgi:hypothetical protein